MISYSICLRLSDLLHLVWYSLSPSLLLQMALFHSVLWLSTIPLCVCMCVYIYTMYTVHVVTKSQTWLSNWAHSTVFHCVCVCVCVHTYMIYLHSYQLYIPTNSFLGGASGKEPACNTGDIRDVGLILRLGRSPTKEMTTHSSILAWRISWTEKHGGLQSMGLQGVRHYWSDLAPMGVQCLLWRNIYLDVHFWLGCFLLLNCTAVYIFRN